MIEWILRIDLESYFYQHELNDLIGVSEYTVPAPSGPWGTSEAAGGEVFSPECPDLSRLHAIVTGRRMLNVLELGSGQSTKVIAHALKENSLEYSDQISLVRRASPFQVLSLESEQRYVDELQKALSKSDLGKHVDLVFSDAKQTTFNGRMCGSYVAIPPVCPDLIYIDGPMPMSYGNAESQYMSMNHAEITNVTCDLLLMEPVLLPGVVVIFDGMTNNARFNARNLQRNWLIHEDISNDFTIMVLDEPLLGVHHFNQVKFQNGIS